MIQKSFELVFDALLFFHLNSRFKIYNDSAMSVRDKDLKLL